MSTDYNGKIDAIQTILSAENTTTASYDLSSNMNSRVQLVTKRNPEFIGVQASRFPAICIRLDSDNKEFEEMARNSTTAKKKSELTFKVMGLLYDDRFVTENNDESDKEIHYLAENIEEVLKRNYNLGNNCLYSYVDRVDFYEALDEEAHFRSCVLDYKVIGYY